MYSLLRVASLGVLLLGASSDVLSGGSVCENIGEPDYANSLIKSGSQVSLDSGFSDNDDQGCNHKESFYEEPVKASASGLPAHRDPEDPLPSVPSSLSDKVKLPLAPLPSKWERAKPHLKEGFKVVGKGTKTVGVAAVKGGSVLGSLAADIFLNIGKAFMQAGRNEWGVMTKGQVPTLAFMKKANLELWSQDYFQTPQDRQSSVGEGAQALGKRAAAAVLFQPLVLAELVVDSLCGIGKAGWWSLKNVWNIGHNGGLAKPHVFS